MEILDVTEIRNLLIADLKTREVKAWQIKHGVIENPYPISQNYVWFLSKEKYMNKIKFPSLCKMQIFFSQENKTIANA